MNAAAKADADTIARLWSEERLAQILRVIREQAELSKSRADARSTSGKPRGGASIVVELVDHEGRLAEVWATRRERVA
jgi:hypothetical protein